MMMSQKILSASTKTTTTTTAIATTAASTATTTVLLLLHPSRTPIVKSEGQNRSPNFLQYLHHHHHPSHPQPQGHRRYYFTNGSSVKKDDPYTILGLRWGDGATTTDIKHAFRSKAKLLHPDIVRNRNSDSHDDSNTEKDDSKTMTIQEAEREFQRLVTAYETLLTHVRGGMNEYDSIDEWRVALWRQSDRMAVDRTDVAGVMKKRPIPPVSTKTSQYGRELGHPSGMGNSTRRGEYLSTSSSSTSTSSMKRRPKQSSSVGRGRSKWTTTQSTDATGKKSYVEWDPTTTTTKTSTT
jgi:hypothetical protein